MRQIFVFTAGDKEARKHLNDSILNPVPFAWMREALGPELTDYYQSVALDKEGFYAWGAVPGPVNKRTWDSMQVGDLVLTVYENQYNFLASVVGKFHNEKLASRIWSRDDEGNTWEYMYQLSRPQPISAGVMSSPVVDYLNRGYRGFTRISGSKVETILKDFGSLENFVQQAFGGSLPETHVEREVRNAEVEADTAAVFNPTDLVDGRKKIVQEVVRRQGQPKFRKQLFAAYDSRCAVTGCDVEAVLEAAHIAPYLGTESNAVQNGLLLRADIHTLFDLGLLKITPGGVVHLHERLLQTEYRPYEGKAIRSPIKGAHAPSVEALTMKFNQIL